MTYEPGASDIFTTNNPQDPEVDDRTDDQVLADMMRAVLSTPAGSELMTVLPGLDQPPHTFLIIPEARLLLDERDREVLKTVPGKKRCDVHIAETR